MSAWQGGYDAGRKTGFVVGSVFGIVVTLALWVTLTWLHK